MDLELPDMIFGIPGNTFLLILSVIVIGWILTKRVEEFAAARPVLTESEYIQDVKNLASYVGPYIGEIYLYLRDKYSAVKNDPMPPMFQPGTVADPTLADPLLPIARAQIKSWLDSGKLRLRQKYTDAVLQQLSTTWDIRYTMQNEGVLQVTYVQNGKPSVYLV